MQIETLLKISEALQVSLNQLLKIFLPESIFSSNCQIRDNIREIRVIKARVPASATANGTTARDFK